MKAIIQKAYGSPEVLELRDKWASPDLHVHAGPVPRQLDRLRREETGRPTSSCGERPQQQWKKNSSSHTTHHWLSSKSHRTIIGPPAAGRGALSVCTLSIAARAPDPLQTSRTCAGSSVPERMLFLSR